MTAAVAEKAIMEARGLAKTFRSGSREIHVLQSVNLEVQPGDTISIRGESGSGKSTLLNLLAGIEEADSGNILWNGQDLKGIPDKKRPALRSSYLGFVFQSFYLVPELNTFENVLLAARISGMNMSLARKSAGELLDELGLSERLESRPDQLSGGERQRTAIARALINQPQVILADEPTGNLDEHTSERVMDQLLRIVEKQGTALVLVTHHPGYAARTRKRFRLVEGILSPAMDPGSAA